MARTQKRFVSFFNSNSQRRFSERAGTVKPSRFSGRGKLFFLRNLTIRRMK